MDLEELFKPYTGDGHTLDNTVNYLRKTAAQNGIRPEAVTLALQQTFAEIKQGKMFSKSKCRCGCGIDKAATDLVHYMRDRMIRIDRRASAAEMKEMSRTFTKAVNEAKKGRMTNWTKSPIMKMLGYNKADADGA